MKHTARKFVYGSLITLLLLSTCNAPAASAHLLEAPAADPFIWWMEPRYELGWTLYDPHNHRYPREYVYPTGYKVGFDACNSPLNQNDLVRNYHWRITGNTLSSPIDLEVGTCRFDKTSNPTPPLLAQGDYSVTLTINFIRLAPASGTLTIRVKDLLIISIGDSSASGEGNPMIGIVPSGTPTWWDQRCHRSSRSGHAFAAQQIENEDPHTSVTYLSFACSGAEVMEGLVLKYAGIDDPGSGFFATPPSQLKNIMYHLCDVPQGSTACLQNPRRADALFVAAGLNDLGFSGILKNCADLADLADLSVDDIFLVGAPHLIINMDWDEIKDKAIDVVLGPLDEILKSLIKWTFNFFGSDQFNCNDSLDPILKNNLIALWSHYDLLATLLRGQAQSVVNDIQAGVPRYSWLSKKMKQDISNDYGNLSATMQKSLIPAAVYFTSYPVDPFGSRAGGGHGCGFFRGIQDDEGDWLYQSGLELNDRIALTALRNRWFYVNGITEAFDGHDYCAGSSWYVSLTQSFLDQYNIDGTMHPNNDGHEAIAAKVVEKYHSPKPDWSLKWRVEVRFDQARVTYDDQSVSDHTGHLVVQVGDDLGRYESLIQAQDIDLGQWVALDASQFTYAQNLVGDELINISATGAARLGTVYLQRTDTLTSTPTVPTAVTLDATLTGTNDYAPTSSPHRTCALTQSDPVQGIRGYDCTTAVSLGPLPGDPTTIQFELKYHVKVTDLKKPLAQFPLPIWKMCGDNCNVGATTMPELADYIQALATYGADVTFERKVLAQISQNLPSVHRSTLDIQRDDDHAYAVALQPDGKFVLAGDAQTNGVYGLQATVVRYTSYGERDADFGNDGIALGGLNDDDAGRAVAIQPDGKIVVAGFRGSSNVDFAVWRFKPDGTPDGTFGLLGFNVVDFGLGDDYGQAVLLQPDGNIIVAGFADNGTSIDPDRKAFALARFKPNGALDNAFGTAGKVETIVGAGFVRARAAALQPDGKIIVVGGHGGDFIVVRYQPNGALDTSFGVNGIKEIDVAGNDEAYSVVVLKDGKIAIAGYSNGDFGLLFLNANGTICACGQSPFDPMLRTDFGTDEIAYTMALDVNGKVVLAGGSRTLPSKIYLARYKYSAGPSLPGYSLDPSFGTQGKEIITVGRSSSARGLIIDANNRMTIAGYSNNGGDDDFALVRELHYVVATLLANKMHIVYLPLVQR
jgi:uncharacterized delta-60 repeat protein